MYKDENKLSKNLKIIILKFANKLLSNERIKAKEIGNQSPLDTYSHKNLVKIVSDSLDKCDKLLGYIQNASTHEEYWSIRLATVTCRLI